MKLEACDTWFSKCIRHRDRWTCQKCGKVFEEGAAQGLDCSHHYGRAKKSVRWDKLNAVALCCKCHRDWHSYPAEGVKWLESYLGKGLFDILAEKAQQIVKVTKAEKKEIAAHYRAEYRRMLADGSREFESWQ